MATTTGRPAAENIHKRPKQTRRTRRMLKQKTKGHTETGELC